MKLRSLLFATLLFTATSGFGAVAISVGFAPPVLPVYEQPVVPVEGYIWTPGYWAYGPFGYYWVPGAWVPPPAVGLYWTPPYWGFANGAYIFNEGYWGPQVGFYGGINYGFGYFGSGYWGGLWDGGVFRYNTAVTRVNETVVRNVFVDRSVLSRQATASRASFNGPGGVTAQPTAQERAAADARRAGPTSQQLARRDAASQNRELRASVNHGRPPASAVQAVNRKVQPATASAQARAGETKTRTATPATASQRQRKTGLARNPSATNRQEAAAREREARLSADRRQAQARENAGRAPTQPVRRPAVAAPRQATQKAQPANTQQQRKRKQQQPGQNEGR